MSAAIQIGKLRHRAILQTSTMSAADDRGGKVATWSEIATCWVDIAPLSGSEAFAAQKQNPDVTHTVTMRYRAGVTPKHRLLVSGTRVFDIRSVLDVNERRQWLQLGCQEYGQ